MHPICIGFVVHCMSGRIDILVCEYTIYNSSGIAYFGCFIDILFYPIEILHSAVFDKTRTFFLQIFSFPKVSNRTSIDNSVIIVFTKLSSGTNKSVSKRKRAMFLFQIRIHPYIIAKQAIYMSLPSNLQSMWYSRFYDIISIYKHNILAFCFTYSPITSRTLAVVFGLSQKS